MPDLEQSLQGRDLGHLRIIAEHWGVEFNAPDARVGIQRLAPVLVNREMLNEVIECLPEGARRALDELCKKDGRLSWAFFTRRYGAVREMGAARRDRERPYLNQLASATEALWYRGLIGRAFFNTPSGPEEFAYLPEEFVAILPFEESSAPQQLGRPATQLEKTYLFAATDRILDDACTMLAGFRRQRTLESLSANLLCGANTPYPLTAAALKGLLASAGLLTPNGAPKPDAVRRFLEASRAQALLQLVNGWLHSIEFNEIRLIPDLETEGEWRNDPLSARRAVLDFLSVIPGSMVGQTGSEERPFWSISSFVAAIRQNFPDFQRSAGDYDAWYLRNRVTNQYLRGFEFWDDVDGALLRFIIGGPLFWLGIVELGLDAEPAADHPPNLTAFRFSAWAQRLLDLQPPPDLPEEKEWVIVRSDASIRVPLLTPRAVRYQIARFSEWEGFAQGVYLYRITPSSLESARQQGLQPPQIQALLKRSSRVIPPGILSALERWGNIGAETHAEAVTILKVSDPVILQALRQSKAARFLGEALDPKTVIIRRSAWKKIAAALAELGYLAETTVEGDE